MFNVSKCTLVHKIKSLSDFASENNDVLVVLFNILCYNFQQSLSFLNVISFFTFIPFNFTMLYVKILGKIKILVIDRRVCLV